MELVFGHMHERKDGRNDEQTDVEVEIVMKIGT